MQNRIPNVAKERATVLSGFGTGALCDIWDVGFRSRCRSSGVWESREVRPLRSGSEAFRSQALNRPSEWACAQK